MVVGVCGLGSVICPDSQHPKALFFSAFLKKPEYSTPHKIRACMQLRSLPSTHNNENNKRWWGGERGNN